MVFLCDKYVGHVIRIEWWSQSMDIVFYLTEWGFPDCENMADPAVTVVCPD
jgi:hypothetical protein